MTTSPHPFSVDATLSETRQWHDTHYRTTTPRGIPRQVGTVRERPGPLQQQHHVGPRKPQERRRVRHLNRHPRKRGARAPENRRHPKGLVPLQPPPGMAPPQRRFHPKPTSSTTAPASASTATPTPRAATTHPSSSGPDHSSLPGSRPCWQERWTGTRPWPD